MAISLDAYADDLDVWVRDEDKTVSYRWLAFNRRIPVDTGTCEEPFVLIFRGLGASFLLRRSPCGWRVDFKRAAARTLTGNGPVRSLGEWRSRCCLGSQNRP